MRFETCDVRKHRFQRCHFSRVCAIRANLCDEPFQVANPGKYLDDFLSEIAVPGKLIDRLQPCVDRIDSSQRLADPFLEQASAHRCLRTVEYPEERARVAALE